MANLLARAALSNLRRQQITLHCTNQQDIDPDDLGLMAIGLQGDTAFIMKNRDDLDDEDILFIKTPTPENFQDTTSFEDEVDFSLFIVLEKQPKSATLGHIYSSDANQVSTDLQLQLGTVLTINLATHHLILSRDATEIFQAEILAYEQFILHRNQEAQKTTGLGQSAGGGPPHAVHHGSAHASTIQFIPGTIRDGPLSAAAFSQPLMLAHGKDSIDKKGVCSHEKIPHLSLKKIENLMLCNFNTQPDGFSLTDFVDPKYLDTFPRQEKIQVIGRFFVEFAAVNFSQLFANSLASMFISLRPVFDFAECFTLTLLLEPIHRKLFNLRLFPIVAHTASCPLGTDLNLHIARQLDAYLHINRRDEEIEYILANHNRSSSAGGGGLSATVDASSVGNKRIREPKVTDSSKQSEYSRWFARSPLPDCKICWHSVLQTEPCANTPTCKNKPKRSHTFPLGTTLQEKKAFVAWLEKKPESS